MFNDPIAAKKFKDMAKTYGIKTVVETGTYLGDSTLQFAKYVPYVYTVEINQEYYIKAANRVCAEKTLNKKLGVIYLHHGNSPDFISYVIGRIFEPVCFYLDAHWRTYWPLKDELKAIKGKPNSFIIIHDFKVPGKDWGYDIWQGQENSYEYIKDDLAAINPNYKISFNEEAEGNKRGILYAIPGN